jgi:PAS domain S-box-containing protein
MKPIKILIVEDLKTDYELACYELRKAEIDFTSILVDAEKQFRQALETFKPELIISDYAMPTFDGMRALKITRNQSTYIPFIILTGSINEETAVACMKAGADDYVIKENIKRLPFSVIEVLRKVRTQKEKEQTEKQLIESEEKYRLLTENAQDLIYRIELLPEQKFSYVSPSATEITGFTPEEHYADPYLGYKLVHPDDRNLLESLSKDEAQIRKPVILRWQKKDGSIIWTEQRNVPIYNQEGDLIALEGIARDITHRKQIELALESSLNEKNQLLRELYHRTKNNMQVIISMLMMQMDRSEDQATRTTFQETVSRIQAMALVHEKLYQSKNLSSIKLDDYIHDLSLLLKKTYQVEQNHIQINLDLQPTSTLIDIAMPCGLVINELISNAFKHAFPHSRAGEITIQLIHHAEQGMIHLVVSDNGIGFPDELDLKQSASFGIPIIISIIEHQLQGVIEFESQNGVTCRIQFPENLYEERV